MAPKNPNHRKHRQMARDRLNGDHEINDRRANTSSEDEDGAFEADPDESDLDTGTALTQADAAVNCLVEHASQRLGTTCADGTALALAAVEQSYPEQAIQFLAAASAKACIDAQQLQDKQDRTNNFATRALVTAELADEGLRNSDVTYDKRYKRQNDINEQQESVNQHQQMINEQHQMINEQQQKVNEQHEIADQQQQNVLQQHEQALLALQARFVRLEGVLGRVLPKLLSYNINDSEVAEMLKELNL